MVSSLTFLSNLWAFMPGNVKVGYIFTCLVIESPSNITWNNNEEYESLSSNRRYHNATLTQLSKYYSFKSPTQFIHCANFLDVAYLFHFIGFTSNSNNCTADDRERRIQIKYQARDGYFILRLWKKYTIGILIYKISSLFFARPDYEPPIIFKYTYTCKMTRFIMIFQRFLTLV